MIRAQRFFALLSLLALCGCGFHPVYGSKDAANSSPVSMDLNNVAIENIQDRNGQILRNALIDRMYGKNRPLQPAYRLVVKLHWSEEDLGILANATATRSLLNMYADYKLTVAGADTDADNKNIATDGKNMVADGKNTLITGTAHSVASFDKLDQMYGAVAARQDAYDRTLHEISEQIVNRVSLYFSERQ